MGYYEEDVPHVLAVDDNLINRNLVEKLLKSSSWRAINLLSLDHVSLSFNAVLCYLQTILNGLWVVLEDIDKALADVQSILLPLLEGASSFLTGHGEHKPSKSGVIIGSTVGGCVLVMLLVLGVIYTVHGKGLATQQSSPFALWDPTSGSGGVPELKGTTFEELKTYTSNVSQTNNIGAGGYGMVYRGSLQNGELIAIKRAQQGSSQGGLEFKTEIELLSRVHHKNVVGLIGFCFNKAEQMLVY
ncbi:Concanavalin A-like lectin/glucanase, subgroup [Cynara cardunculus var. scolymus]|uniref:Concanavalin A-like lectin/glucanase, subgroup n=1 Tax=Cynara cardunculus var. scolymus TaxID=59895 RepID=A0A103Y368_CYNCS|nr:Concanavalin A-like lectin/glucanase, subgroup [Cynara cardunculus var. scolymus]